MKTVVDCEDPYCGDDILINAVFHHDYYLANAKIFDELEGINNIKDLLSNQGLREITTDGII
jgi:hypothetical protein